jgi:hypothetical protein
MSTGTLDFGNGTTTVNFTVTSGVIIGRAAGNDMDFIAPNLNIGIVATEAGITVTAIGDGAFASCTFLVAVTIPASVTSIGGNAFFGCSNLTTVTYSDIASVESIGNRAFAYTGLTSISFPTNVRTIGDGVYDNCNALSGNLVIPDFITSIGVEAFQNSGYTGTLTFQNTSLLETISDYAFAQNLSGAGFTGSLTIPNSVETIGASAFQNCSEFDGTLLLPANIEFKTIGASAFYDCSKFTGTLTIPNTVETIGASAFSGCYRFTGALTIPNSVTSIGQSAFFACTGFTGTLTISPGVTSIAQNTFASCTALTGPLTIPSEVTSIGYHAFHSCSGFATIAIPSSVVSIETGAFVGITGITEPTQISFSCNNPGFTGIFTEGQELELFYTSESLTGWENPVDGYTATLTGGGGGAGDPYVTTFSNISYKLPTMDAPIRYFQTMDGGKLLTVNVQLKTVENAELADDTLRSLIVLRKKMTTKQYAAMVAKVMKPETLCFFERISIQYGEQRLVVNLWDSKFELVENTLRCAVEKVDRADLLKKSGGIYNGYKPDTIKLTLGRTAVFLSTYNSPLIRNGIYIESAALKGANGVVVNALSAGAMTLSSLASVEPVAAKDSLKAVTKVETFVDHDGLRTRNVVTYK